MLGPFWAFNPFTSADLYIQIKTWTIPF